MTRSATAAAAAESVAPTHTPRADTPIIDINPVSNAVTQLIQEVSIINSRLDLVMQHLSLNNSSQGEDDNGSHRNMNLNNNTRNDPVDYMCPNVNKPVIKTTLYDGSTSFEDYIAQFSIIALNNHWSVTEQGFQLAAALRGPAMSVLASLPLGNRADFQLLKDNLKLRFGLSKTDKLYYAQFHNRRQQEGEDYASLGNDIRRLAHLAFSDCVIETQERIATQQFLQAIKDDSIREKLILHEPTTISIAIQKALELQALKSQTVSRMMPNNTVNIDEIVGRLSTQMEETVKQFENRRRRFNGRIRCWNCGELGHVQAQCSGGNFFQGNAPKPN